MIEVVLATHNKGKIKEFEALFEGLSILLSSAADYNLPEPEETGSSFEENALIKAEFVSQRTGKIAISDDSGLEVAALNGAPGIYTADWAETGDGRDFNMAMQKVETKLLEFEPPFVANFTAVICVVQPCAQLEFYRGEAHGHLEFPPRGTTGFGYDPIFVPEGYDQTFAELPNHIKNKISHRAKAFEKLKQGFNFNG